MTPEDANWHWALTGEILDCVDDASRAVMEEINAEMAAEDAAYEKAALTKLAASEALQHGEVAPPVG